MSDKTDREKFMKYRNQIVEILNQAMADDVRPSFLCAAALNELFTYGNLYFRVESGPLSSFRDSERPWYNEL